MKNIKTFIKSWSLPDRTQERAQLTVRINYDLYAKLQALKEIYPKRSVNDMVGDILQVGVDEIIEALPINIVPYTADDIFDAVDATGLPQSHFEKMTHELGLGVEFRSAYSRILEKAQSESTTEEAE